MRGGHRAQRGSWLRAAISVSVLAFLCFLAGGVLATSPRAPSAVHVGATDSVTFSVGGAFAFAPDAMRVNPLPGDTIALTIIQMDSVDHTFTLSSQTNGMIPSSDTADQLATFFRTNPPLVNLTINGTPGTIHFSFPAPQTGYYEFVCLKQGHFQAGMAGFLGVNADPPNLPNNTGPGAPVFIIGGVIAGLVVLAVILAFVIGRRRGSAHEMPPERVGYPEPPQGPTKPP